jgi:xylulose-5-phosphate/fructose-6-phosphate phosphoketolase
MTVRNTLDRFHLVLDVIARVPGLGSDSTARDVAAYCHARLAEHEPYIREHGDDMPDVRDWRWIE